LFLLARNTLTIPSAIIVTTSSKKERLEGYLGVGDFDLTDDDVAAIDRAGSKGALWDERKSRIQRAGQFLLASMLGYAVLRAVCGN